MSSSKSPRQVPPPAGLKPQPYARFIPREELQEFASWSPDSWTEGANAAPAGKAAGQKPGQKPGQSAEAAAADAAPTRAELDAALQGARHAGYEDGYRDGLAALESFKRSFAAQVSAQAQALVASAGTQFDALEQVMAETVATTALKLARQVVRSEIDTRPEMVEQVATDAVNALVLSARHVRVRVHPDDHALVAAGSADALAARGAQLIADPLMSRGGCFVESDLGSVDARVAMRWKQACAPFGRNTPWDDPDPEGEA